MKVIIKEPRKKAYAAEIENTLEALQEAVDGYIGFVGTIVFCGTDGEDFTDFPGDI